jgi:hypothetical protein
VSHSVASSGLGHAIAGRFSETSEEAALGQFAAVTHSISMGGQSMPGNEDFALNL